jgi:hypothetical protein
VATLGGFERSRAASPPMRTTNPTKRVGLKSHGDGPGMPFANKGLAKASPKAVTAAPERASSSDATAVPASQSALAVGSWLLAVGCWLGGKQTPGAKIALERYFLVTCRR